MTAKCDNCGTLSATVRYVESEEFCANVCTSCVPVPKPTPRPVFQTVAQVRAAVDAGLRVGTSEGGYTVIKDSIGQYLLRYGESYIGLSGREGSQYENRCNIDIRLLQVLPQ